MSATAFSSGDDAISRKITCTSLPTQAGALTEVYEISNCAAWITNGSFKRVALQFPDELLADAVRVVEQIQEKISTECRVFILGDTSYGSCCVDEVGAQHYKADCIIHYGRACLSPTTLLPVLYVFGRSGIDVVDCVCRIQDMCTDRNMKIILAYDTTFSHAIDEVFCKLQPMCKCLIQAKLLIPNHRGSVGESDSRCDQTNLKSENQADKMQETSMSHVCIVKCGRTIQLPIEESIEEYSFIFIGDSASPTLTNLMMNFNKCPFYTYDPTSKVCQRETLNVNKALMKRYYLIERAKDANIVGIVAGTLGVAKYRDIIDHLKKLIKNAGKKSYTFVVGKLNPAKLANFAEIDVYVLVACPESSLLDQSDFFSPVVTPLEIEIACNQAREWTGDYSTDFREILPGASMYVETPPSEENEDKADVSLISNRIRTVGIVDSPEVCDAPSQNVVLRSEAMAVTAVSENAGEFLANRSWKGLEQKLGETPVTKATEGQRGIAASYEHEPT